MEHTFQLVITRVYEDGDQELLEDEEESEYRSSCFMFRACFAAPARICSCKCPELDLECVGLDILRSAATWFCTYSNCECTGAGLECVDPCVEAEWWRAIA